MNYFVLLALAALLMLAGIVGVILPVLPGVPFMFLIALGFAFLSQFVRLTTNELVILGVIALITFVVDYLAGTIGARWSGASGKSLMVGLVGLIIGVILFPPLGGIVGLFGGIFIAEYLIHRNRDKALKAAAGSAIGSLAGVVINLLLATTFLGLFIYFALTF